ncbi:hypothetical protein [Phaeovulum sp.]|uniref:hypothetical protein n=1 Tax=Phaeovulum sp. TaxID=2934796 RepID=UPI00356B30BA
MLSLKALLVAGVCAIALPASADILFSGQYLIVSRGAMAAGAAYLVIESTGPTEVRLVGASSPIPQGPNCTPIPPARPA